MFDFFIFFNCHIYIYSYSELFLPFLFSPFLQNNASRLAQAAESENVCHSFQSFNTCYKDTGLW